MQINDYNRKINILRPVSRFTCVRQWPILVSNDTLEDYYTVILQLYTRQDSQLYIH